MFELIEGECEIYFFDNLAMDNQKNEIDIFRVDSSNLVNSFPIWNENIHPIPVRYVKEYILLNSGANPGKRDMVDTRIINSIKEGKGTIINSELDVYGYPYVAPSHSPFRKEEWDLKKLKRKDKK